jgi:hypothetical protein
MEAAGYREQHDDPRRNANLWHYGWGVAFFHPDGFMVEANHRLFPPVSPCPPKLFADGQHCLPALNVSIGGTDICIPSPAAHLLLACIHALWHGGERLGWFADIAGLMVRHHELSKHASRLAGSSQFAHVALQVGIRVADTCFGPGVTKGNDMPPLSKPNRTRVASVTQRILDTLQRGSSLSPHNCLALQKQMVSPSTRIGLLLRRGLIPGDGDFQQQSFPRNLRLLYWPYRPARILMQIIRAKSRQSH